MIVLRPKAVESGIGARLLPSLAFVPYGIIQAVRLHGGELVRSLAAGAAVACVLTLAVLLGPLRERIVADGTELSFTGRFRRAKTIGYQGGSVLQAPVFVFGQRDRATVYWGIRDAHGKTLLTVNADLYDANGLDDLRTSLRLEKEAIGEPISAGDAAARYPGFAPWWCEHATLVVIAAVIAALAVGLAL